MFGKNLKSIRIAKHLTQDEMCKVLNMSQSAYNKYENEKTIPPADLIKKVSREFHISTDELLREVKDDEIDLKDDSMDHQNLTDDRKDMCIIPKEFLNSILEQQQLLFVLLKDILGKIK